MTMNDVHDDLQIEPLPELADDGTVGVVADFTDTADLEALEREPSALDDSLIDDAFDAGFDEDEESFLGYDENDVDIGDVGLSDDEGGFLDDAPSHGLDVGFEVPPENLPVVGSDVGQEGLDEPIVPRTRGEDEVDLPPLEPASSDEADDLDVGISILPI